MRPAKQILLLFADETELSIMSYSLKTTGYRVIGVTDHHQALIELAHEDIDLVIVSLKLPCTTVENPIIESLKAIKSHVPILLFRGKSDLQLPHPATVVRDRKTAISEILEHIKVLVARKRGPRKGSPEAMRCGPRAATA